MIRCWLHTLNGNGRRLLAFSAVYQLLLSSLWFAQPNVGSHPPSRVQVVVKVDPAWIFSDAAIRQPTYAKSHVRGPPLVKPESNHNLVTVNFRLLGRFAPNRRKREMEGQTGG